MPEQEIPQPIHEQVSDENSAEFSTPQDSLDTIAQKQLETKLVAALRDIRFSQVSAEEVRTSLNQLDKLTHELTGQGIEKLKLQLAKEIMGESFFGPDEVKAAFLDQVDVSEIPSIPFASEELEKAKELGQMLILRIEKAKDGSALSMKKMQELLDGKMKDGTKPLQGDWYKEEKFYTTEAPEASWALVSKEVVPDSPNKNYLQQTQVLIDYLRNEVFKDVEIPAEYADAMNEFESEKAEIAAIVSSSVESEWRKAAQMLEELKINRLTRRSPAEALYDLVVYFQNNGERLLPDTYSWTNRRNSSGSLVYVGYFESDGVVVSGDSPGESDSYFGDSFSRSR